MHISDVDAIKDEGRRTKLSESMAMADALDRSS
jgi:hypothetical protein